MAKDTGLLARKGSVFLFGKHCGVVPLPKLCCVSMQINLGLRISLGLCGAFLVHWEQCKHSARSFKDFEAKQTFSSDLPSFAFKHAAGMGQRSEDSFCTAGSSKPTTFTPMKHFERAQGCMVLSLVFLKHRHQYPALGVYILEELFSGYLVASDICMALW